MVLIATPSRRYLTSQPPTLPPHLLRQDMTQGICHSSSNTLLFCGACSSLCLKRPSQIRCLTNSYSSFKAQAKATFSTRPLPDPPSEGSLLAHALCCCGTYHLTQGSSQVRGLLPRLPVGSCQLGRDAILLYLKPTAPKVMLAPSRCPAHSIVTHLLSLFHVPGPELDALPKLSHFLFKITLPSGDTPTFGEAAQLVHSGVGD